MVKSAAALGAVAANYAAVDGFVLEQGQISGVEVRDQLSGDTFTVRGRVVVNAAGPWVDSVRLLGEPGDKPRLRLTKGIHLGIRTERTGLSRIVVMNARDKRGVFAIPRGAVTYLGTTDTDYPQPEDYPYITADDVDVSARCGESYVRRRSTARRRRRRQRLGGSASAAATGRQEAVRAVA